MRAYSLMAAGDDSPSEDASLDMHTAMYEVLSKYPPGSLISTRAAIRDIRRRLPHLAAGDEQLANRIAEHAIGMGLSVTFDSRGEES